MSVEQLPQSLLVEFAFQEIRAIRSRLIAEADHLVETALDKGIDETAFRQYRQALRDIPQTFNKPEDVVWPQKPSLPQS